MFTPHHYACYMADLPRLRWVVPSDVTTLQVRVRVTPCLLRGHRIRHVPTDKQLTVNKLLHKGEPMFLPLISLSSPGLLCLMSRNVV